jgi:hypothetical protein
VGGGGKELTAAAAILVAVYPLVTEHLADQDHTRPLQVPTWHCEFCYGDSPVSHFEGRGC